MKKIAEDFRRLSTTSRNSSISYINFISHFYYISSNFSPFHSVYRLILFFSKCDVRNSKIWTTDSCLVAKYTLEMTICARGTKRSAFVVQRHYSRGLLKYLIGFSRRRLLTCISPIISYSHECRCQCCEGISEVPRRNSWQMLDWTQTGRIATRTAIHHIFPVLCLFCNV